MTDYIKQMLEWLNQLTTLPAAGLVLCVCIVWGYALRFIKRFPNDGIPVAVILLGALLECLLADSRTAGQSLRLWVVRNIAVGTVIGFVAWMLHKIIISRIESWVLSKLPSASDTTFFSKLDEKPSKADQNTVLTNPPDQGKTG